MRGFFFISTFFFLQKSTKFITNCRNRNPSNWSYYFLLPICRESSVFGSNFRNGDFDGFTCLEVPRIRKTHFQQMVCVYVCVSVISITQKQITAETSNLVFYICIIYRCYLKLFIGNIDRRKTKYRGTQKYSSTLRHMERIFCY